MRKSGNRLRMSYRPAQKMSLKTSMRMLIIAGSSALLITAGGVIYFNFSNIQISQAAVSQYELKDIPVNHDFDIPQPVIIPELTEARKTGSKIATYRKLRQ